MLFLFFLKGGINNFEIANCGIINVRITNFLTKWPHIIFLHSSLFIVHYTKNKYIKIHIFLNKKYINNLSICTYLTLGI